MRRTIERRGLPVRQTRQPAKRPTVASPQLDLRSNAQSQTNTVEEAERIAAASGLTYVSDTMPGIRRRRKSGKFEYFRPDQRRVRSLRELRRIAGLAIPPAYRDVWICLDPRGHLQATGRDARGRKQYRYHPEWEVSRDAVKFDRMVAFARALPALRRRLRADLALKGLPLEKVLALIVTLLDVTRLRIGNPEYVRDNNSFGLSTLRNRHARFIRDRRVLLRFRGKGGAAHEIVIDDRRLVRLVRKCQELPGQQLFQYRDDDGAVRDIGSGQVNEYLRSIMGEAFTAKDFRTWGATLGAIRVLAMTPLPEPLTEKACRERISAAVKQVATELRNTPAVCRKSYINPVVFDAWRGGRLPAALPNGKRHRRAEKIALSFLQREARKATRRRA